MTAKRTVHVVTHRNWQVEELHAKNWEAKQSHGLSVPAHQQRDSWWMPQAYAVRFNQSLAHHGQPLLNFTAPTPDLLSKTPRDYSGRSVGVVTVYDALNSMVEWPDDLWWKMATAKNDDFPCQPLNHDGLVETLDRLSLPLDSLLQFSAPLPKIVSEHRFFVTDRTIKACSGYLKDGVTVYDGALFTGEEILGAGEFAQSVLADESFDLPRAFVMDVALTVEGPVVLEYNPAWCSAWYDGDIPGVLETIRLSTNPTKKELKSWGYQPDDFFMKRPSRILPVDSV